MSEEANIDISETSSPEAQAGAELSKLLGKPEPEVKEEPEGEELEAETDKPKEEPKEEPEDELSPQVLMKMARQKSKAAERKEKEVTAYVEKVREVASQVAEKEKMIVGILEAMPKDISSAWDNFAKMAGLDPTKAWEALVRAKVKGEKVETPKPEVSPELSAIRSMLEGLQRKFEEQTENQTKQGVQQRLIQQHIGTAEYIASAKDTYQFASLLSEEELNSQIQNCIIKAHKNPNLDASYPAIARAIDKMAKAQYDRWNRGPEGATGTSKPAEPSAKAPLKGSRKPSLSNEDSAVSGGTQRELTEIERIAEAGETLQKMFGI